MHITYREIIIHNTYIYITIKYFKLSGNIPEDKYI